MCLLAVINVANSRTITVEYDGKIDTILLSEEDIRYMEVQESDDQNEDALLQPTNQQIKI